jgi:hypothetical protein
MLRGEYGLNGLLAIECVQVMQDIDADIAPVDPAHFQVFCRPVFETVVLLSILKYYVSVSSQ